MKKLLISMAIVATGFAAFAQKPAAGNITTEIGFTNLVGSPANPQTLNIPMGMLRGRYFLNEGMAVRASLGFGMTSATSVVDDDGLNPVVDKSEKTAKTTGFGIALGIEKHLAGTSNLSPYIGAEFGFSSASGTTDVTNSNNGTTFTKGDKYSTSGGGTTTIALNGILGADYYITEKVYIGAEMAFGLYSMTSKAEGEMKATSGGTTVTGKTAASSSNAFGIYPTVMPVIRLGIILM